MVLAQLDLPVVACSNLKSRPHLRDSPHGSVGRPVLGCDDEDIPNTKVGFSQRDEIPLFLFSDPSVSARRDRGISTAFVCFC